MHTHQCAAPGAFCSRFHAPPCLTEQTPGPAKNVVGMEPAPVACTPFNRTLDHPSYMLVAVHTRRTAAKGHPATPPHMQTWRSLHTHKRAQTMGGQTLTIAARASRDCLLLMRHTPC